MTEPRSISVPHLGRVEGHGGIVVRLAGTDVADVDMTIHEGSRYYEALLVGKHYLEVQGIITRVCAICSADHSVAALAAIENALGIPVSERTRRLRDLLVLGSAIESHALHVFALALPDFLGFDSMLSMATAYPAEATSALRLKQLGNRIQELVGGRPVHPINTLIGGFGRLPRPRELVKLREDLAATVDPLLEFVDLLAGLSLPDLPATPTTFVALCPVDHPYGFRGDELVTSGGTTHCVADYRDVVHEYPVEHSHAKHSRLDGDTPFTVGALARLALWADRLHGHAREAYARLFPQGATDDILRNNHAQVVETVHCLERAMGLIDELVELGPDEAEIPPHETRAGRGIAAIEAPRGTLFHEYVLDEHGVVRTANVVTPTSQNLASIEGALRATAVDAAGRGATDAVLRSLLEIVVRAYDPCISCSVHVLQLGPTT